MALPQSYNLRVNKVSLKSNREATLRLSIILNGRAVRSQGHLEVDRCGEHPDTPVLVRYFHF